MKDICKKCGKPKMTEHVGTNLAKTWFEPCDCSKIKKVKPRKQAYNKISEDSKRNYQRKVMVDLLTYDQRRIIEKSK